MVFIKKRSNFGVNPGETTHVRLRRIKPGPATCLSAALAIRARFSPSSRIHSVFHVVFLKKHEGALPAEPVDLPSIRHGRVLPSPDVALCARLNRGNREVFIQWVWVSCRAGDATWSWFLGFTSIARRAEVCVDAFVGETLL